MGFYIRKAFSFGPLRLNLSKSGLGLSAGVRGARLGAGPRGAYVHMGAKGLYYRKRLNPGKGVAATGRRGARSAPTAGPGLESLGPIAPIDSGDIAGLADASSAELLAAMQRRRSAGRRWPWALLGALLLGGAAVAVAPALGILLGLLGAAGAAALAALDQARRSTALFYDLDPETEARFQALHAAFAAMAGCARCWHVEGETHDADPKRNAGSARAALRRPIALRRAAPPFIETNIAVPAIPAGRQTLYFFPDMLLVVEPGGVGAVAYPALDIALERVRTAEYGGLPKDAVVVGSAWQFANKDGGRDRRFKHNREVPLVDYEDLHFTSATGLNERIRLSAPGAGAAFRAACRGLADHEARA